MFWQAVLPSMKKANAYLEKHPAPSVPPASCALFPDFDSPDFKITADGITFSDSAEVPVNLLTAKPRYVKGIATSPGGGVIFNMGKQGSNQAVWNAAVEPGRKYRRIKEERQCHSSCVPRGKWLPLV